MKFDIKIKLVAGTGNEFFEKEFIFMTTNPF